MKKYKESQERFNNIDGNNYGAALWSKDIGSFYLEGRINRNNGAMSIIQFWPNGECYHVYIDSDVFAAKP